MSAMLNIVPLRGQRIAQVVPLVQTRKPDYTLDMLMCALQEKTERGTEDEGIVAFETDRGYVVGLFTYSVLRDVIDGALLMVNNFISMDVIGRYGTVDAMLLEIEALARRTGAAKVKINLVDEIEGFPRNVDSVTAKFRAAGLQFEGMSLTKAVTWGDA